MKTQKLRSLLVQKSDSNQSTCIQQIAKFARAVDDLYASIIDYLTSADPDHRYFHVSTFEVHIRDYVGSYNVNELTIDIGNHRLIFRPIQSNKGDNCGLIQVTNGSNSTKSGITLHLNSKFTGTPTNPNDFVNYNGYSENTDQWTFCSSLTDKEEDKDLTLIGNRNYITRFLSTPNTLAILLDSLI